MACLLIYLKIVDLDAFRFLAASLFDTYSVVTCVVILVTSTGFPFVLTLKAAIPLLILALISLGISLAFNRAKCAISLARCYGLIARAFNLFNVSSVCL